MSDIYTSIRVEKKTIDMLQELKPSYEKIYPEKFISNDLIIKSLVLEHDPKVIEEKKLELLKDYVNKNDFDDIFNKKMEFEDKIIELTKKLEDSLKELEKLKADLNLAKEKYQNNINDLNNGLTAKKTELFILSQKNNELTEKIMNLEINFKDLQEKHAKCNLDYTCLKEFVDNQCVTMKKLKVMSFIAHFLYEHRFSKFKVDELTAELMKFKSFGYEDFLYVRETLTLHNLFLVERIELDKVNYFRFDKRL